MKAEEWREVVSKAMGKKWLYRFILHSTVTKIDPFEGIVISNVYKI